MQILKENEGMTDFKKLLQYYRYVDQINEIRRVEERDIRDLHFKAVRNPMRDMAKFELKKKNKDLNY